MPPDDLVVPGMVKILCTKDTAKEGPDKVGLDELTLSRIFPFILPFQVAQSVTTWKVRMLR